MAYHEATTSQLKISVVVFMVITLITADLRDLHADTRAVRVNITDLSDTNFFISSSLSQSYLSTVSHLCLYFVVLAVAVCCLYHVKND